MIDIYLESNTSLQALELQLLANVFQKSYIYDEFSSLIKKKIPLAETSQKQT